MKKPGKRFLRLVAVVVLAPPALWIGLLILLPMGWARDRVVAALGASTHQVVRIEKVRLRPWGGLELTGLEIASPSTPDDPWLRAATVSVDGRITDFLHNRVKPTACRASGVAMRVHRNRAGVMEFDGMFGQAPPRPNLPTGRHDVAEPDDHELSVSLDDARVTVVDDATGTRLDLAGVHARATVTRARIDLTDLAGTINGGRFAATARVDRAAGHAISATIHARDVNLGVGMGSLAYMIPLLAPNGKSDHARGTLAIDADLQAHGDSGAELARTLTGRGNLALEGLTLDDSRILDEVQTLLPVPTRGQLGSLNGHFAIADRRVSTADTVLKVAEVPIDLAGWSDFDGRLDYLVKCEQLGKAVNRLTNRLPSEAREFLADLQVNDLASLADVRVFGTIDRPHVKSVGLPPAPKKTAAANAKPVAKRPGLRASDKAKLKEAANRLLERAIR